MRRATHNLYVSIDPVIGLRLLATTLEDKHMGVVLPNFVLVRRRLESLFTDIIGGAFSLSLLLCPPLTDPIQQQHEFPHKPVLDIVRSSCPQMSISLHVLLKADPCLEGDAADGKADPFACHQLGQVSVLLYF